MSFDRSVRFCGLCDNVSGIINDYVKNECAYDAKQFGRSIKKFGNRNKLSLPVFAVSAALFATMLAVGQAKGIRGLSIAAVAPGLVGLSSVLLIVKNERTHKRNQEYEVILN